MTESQRWERAFAVCREMLVRPEDERAACLDRACAGNTSLRSDVESLLARDAEAGSFLEPPTSAGVARLFGDAGPVREGVRIGAYTIRGVLGRGGMGTVYRAEQDSPRREVALKMMRSLPLADDLTPALFRRETRALARLEHSGIAAIHDAGTTPDGWHYFAMELVDGPPLTEFAAQRNLALRERLELFRRVCEAVHAAHQRGVIHRDLKPSNILVTSDGQPKVLDFGLARIADPEGQHTRITESGAFQGTLAYASPEHVRESREGGSAIDVHSDVYSLGVILYELMTGELPYRTAGLPVAAAARVIGEQSPRPPESIRKDLRGDVSTILRKALEKEPGRRYASAAALAEDLERYLTRKPIVARAPSAAYVLRKFVARNRALVGAALGVALAMVLALLGLAYGFLEATSARRVAESALRDRAAAVRLNGFRVLRDSHLEAGRYDDAVDATLRGLELCEQAYSNESMTVAIAESHYVSLLIKRAHATNGVAACRQEAERIVAWTRSRHGDDFFRTTQTEMIVAYMLLAVGDAEGAEPFARACYEASVRAFPDDHKHAWLKYNAMSTLGHVYVEQGSLSEAEPLLVDSASWMLTSPLMPERDDLDGADRRRESVERVILLYERWHKVVPDAGHDARAEAWRRRL